MDRKEGARMVFNTEIQLEFDFIKKEKNEDEPKQQERYYEYMLRRMREERIKEENANL